MHGPLNVKFQLETNCRSLIDALSQQMLEGQKKKKKSGNTSFDTEYFKAEDSNRAPSE